MTDLPPGSDGTPDPGTPDPGTPEPGHDAGASSPTPGGTGPGAAEPPPAGPPAGPPPGPPAEPPAGGEGSGGPPPSSPPPTGTLDLVFGSFSRGWERMVELLFRGPYANVRGWFAWGLVILLAGVVGAGFMGNFRVPGGNAHTRELLQGMDMPDASALDQAFRDTLASFERQEPGTIVAAAILVFLVFLLGVVVLWVTTVFRYVFLEDVIEGRPAIREPFSRAVRRSPGYFVFRLAIHVAGLALFAAVFLLFRQQLFAWALGGKEDPEAVLPMILFFLFVGAPVMIILGILDWFVHDLVLPVHVLRGGTFGAALGEGFALAGRNFLAVLVYAASQLLARVVAAVAAVILYCVTCCLWLPPTVVLSGLLLVVTMLFLPLAILTIPLFLGVVFLLKWVLATMIAPWPVFVRAWSVTFVRGLLGEGGSPAAGGTP